MFKVLETGKGKAQVEMATKHSSLAVAVELLRVYVHVVVEFLCWRVLFLHGAISFLNGISSRWRFVQEV